ncbi:F-box/WD repeat-containing protein 2 isoform X3 [Corvus cornix cornix]|uniref:F-box/WD repeat-containing protein 2 isoform X3 n=1 Tax=Corvus cornix cornix TaxID=932674 RepID=UPI00053460AB|nr:F-box/WD repeat-containing protein 2 isoform X3 [Corvus cornix cornix]
MTLRGAGSRLIVRAAIRQRLLSGAGGSPGAGSAQPSPTFLAGRSRGPCPVLRVTLLSWLPADCGAGCGSAVSRSCRGSDGRREAPGRAGLRESAQAAAAARRRTAGAGLLPEKNETLDHLISLSGAVQLRHLSNNLEILLKRDFLKLLPLELSFYLLKWLDPQTLLTCCLVSKQWNKVISACTEVWQTACKNLGWQIDDSVQDPLHWKKVYLKAILRMKQLKDHEAFETSSLIGHSARVYALYYKDGLLCTGSDDLSAKLWDVSTGQCIYGIQTHTCAAVKFDEQKLVTGSFDNTVACWEWSSGAKTQHFRGHTGAVFSVDYNDELDILVSGSADFTVKVWALSTGTCLNTLTGHTEWVTKVVLQKCKVKSLMHSPGDYILLSADKYEIKIWPIGREINCKCLRTLSVSEDRSISLQPRLHFDGLSNLQTSQMCPCWALERYLLYCLTTDTCI